MATVRDRNSQSRWQREECYSLFRLLFPLFHSIVLVSRLNLSLCWIRTPFSFSWKLIAALNSVGDQEIALNSRHLQQWSTLRLTKLFPFLNSSLIVSSFQFLGFFSKGKTPNPLLYLSISSLPFRRPDATSSRVFCSSFGSFTHRLWSFFRRKSDLSSITPQNSWNETKTPTK